MEKTKRSIKEIRFHIGVGEGHYLEFLQAKRIVKAITRYIFNKRPLQSFLGAEIVDHFLSHEIFYDVVAARCDSAHWTAPSLIYPGLEGAPLKCVPT